jgi:hypothetical protein
MKTRSFLTLSALAVTLLTSGISAIAEEGGSTVGTTLGSTSISGYVDSSFAAPVRHRGWLRAFLQAFKFRHA